MRKPKGTEITIPYNFKPRDYQIAQYKAMDNGIKRAIKCWHRRAGKDLCDWNYLIKRAVEDKPGAYWYIFPTLKQGRKALWEGFTKDGMPYLGFIPDQLRKRVNNQEMIIELVNGAVIRVVDAIPDKSVGAGVRGAVFSEYSLMRPSMLEYVEPMLLENNGWAIFNGTPRGENHFYKLLMMAKANPAWFAQVCTIEDTGVVTLEQIDALRLEGRPEELIQQEYYCSFNGSILGAYYAKEMADIGRSGRIKTLEYDASYLVNTAWDIGIGDSTAVWFYQVCNNQVRIIDYFEQSGWGLPKWAEYLKGKPYSYGAHYAPHDMEAREFGTGQSRIDQAKKLGITFKVCPKLRVEDGISAVRNLLPRCIFSVDRCKEGIDALKQYRAEWDEEKHILSAKPLHDWSSHGADAFRYLALTLTDDRPKFNYSQLYD